LPSGRFTRADRSLPEPASSKSPAKIAGRNWRSCSMGVGPRLSFQSSSRVCPNCNSSSSFQSLIPVTPDRHARRADVVGCDLDEPPAETSRPDDIDLSGVLPVGRQSRMNSRQHLSLVVRKLGVHAGTVFTTVSPSVEQSGQWVRRAVPRPHPDHEMVVTNGQQWSLAVTPNRWLTWGIPGFLGFFRTSRVPSHARSRQFDPAIAHSRFPLVRSDSSTTRLRELGSNDRAHPCPTSADECNLGSGREIQRPDEPDRVALNVKSPLRHVGLQVGL
jgi:hypothetical protein